MHDLQAPWSQASLLLQVYDMASCCGACQATKAVLIDDGPSVCSMQFFTGADKMANSYNSVKRQEFEEASEYWTPPDPGKMNWELWSEENRLLLSNRCHIFRMIFI